MTQKATLKPYLEEIRQWVEQGCDLLVVNGGTSAGVQLGQQFFIRRTMTFGGSGSRSTFISIATN